MIIAMIIVVVMFIIIAMITVVAKTTGTITITIARRTKLIVGVLRLTFRCAMSWHAAVPTDRRTISWSCQSHFVPSTALLGQMSHALLSVEDFHCIN